MDYYREVRLWTYRFYQVRQWDGKQLHLRQAARMFARGKAHFAGWYHHAEQVQVVLVVGGLYPRYHQQCSPAGLGREEQGEARRSIQPQLCLRRHQSSDFGKRKGQNGVVSIGYDLWHYGRSRSPRNKRWIRVRWHRRMRSLICTRTATTRRHPRKSGIIITFTMPTGIRSR